MNNLMQIANHPNSQQSYIASASLKIQQLTKHIPHVCIIYSHLCMYKQLIYANAGSITTSVCDRTHINKHADAK